LIYDCKRSASVVANNYCTLAKLDSNKFHDICSKYPQILKEMKEQIFVYDDENEVFMSSFLNKIEFLRNAELDIFHEVMYNFKQETFDAGTTIFK
jgi:CRP-like cAMP-binding protein